MSAASYKETKSAAKDENNKRIVSYAKRYLTMHNARCLILDGPFCNTARALIDAGIHGGNIISIERDSRSAAKQIATGLGNNIIHTSVAEHIAQHPEAGPWEIIYLDYMGTWTGSSSTGSYPLDEIWKLMTRAGKDDSTQRVVFAVTFSWKNNYGHRHGNYMDDVRDAISQMPQGKRFDLHDGEQGIVRFLLECCIFPCTGWRPLRNIRPSDVRYRRSKKSQWMMHLAYTLVRTPKIRDVRWPVVDGGVPGWPIEKEIEWDLLHVRDLA
jgi:hypothetical protein